MRAVDQLRELGLAAVVHTESGRSERYRHYARKRFPFNEAQLAIMTELWLRGRQSAGDLRTRASRMHDIPTLEQLRDELKSLQAQGFIQANGPLEVRGIEVDHNFYKPDENKTLAAGDFSSPREEADPSPRSTATASASESRIASLEQSVADLTAQLSQLSERFEALRRELGANV